ncbi:hypothetical protein DL93DRAFT_486622 [Clavulina sp. PMI_390]|nr:hypothetical protein DL93DRAFT_486622 [Clavulina sp. PMI_390]
MFWESQRQTDGVTWCHPSRSVLKLHPDRPHEDNLSSSPPRLHCPAVMAESQNPLVEQSSSAAAHESIPNPSMGSDEPQHIHVSPREGKQVGTSSGILGDPDSPQHPGSNDDPPEADYPEDDDGENENDDDLNNNFRSKVQQTAGWKNYIMASETCRDRGFASTVETWHSAIKNHPFYHDEDMYLIVLWFGAEMLELFLQQPGDVVLNEAFLNKPNGILRFAAEYIDQQQEQVSRQKKKLAMAIRTRLSDSDSVVDNIGSNTSPVPNASRDEVVTSSRLARSVPVAGDEGARAVAATPPLSPEATMPSRGTAAMGDASAADVEPQRSKTPSRFWGTMRSVRQTLSGKKTHATGPVEGPSLDRPPPSR